MIWPFSSVWKLQDLAPSPLCGSSIHTLPRWPRGYHSLDPLCPSAHNLRGIRPGPTACAFPTWRAYHRPGTSTRPPHPLSHATQRSPLSTTATCSLPRPGPDSTQATAQEPAQCPLPAQQSSGCSRVYTGTPSGLTSLLSWGCHGPCSLLWWLGALPSL